jgi:hypothetical protein
MAVNPAATGPAGPAFEAKVGATFLTLLLTRGTPLGLGSGTLRTVHLQAAHLNNGWQTDDILLEAMDATGEPAKAALQVKRTFSISISDEECVKTLRGALADFRNSKQFDQTRDIIALVTSSLSAKLARGLRTLLDCARASLSAKDMARRLAIPNYLGKPALGYLETIREILAGAENGAPTDDELWRFLSRFHVVDLDLNEADANGLAETFMRSLLMLTLPDSDANTADATWKELITLALSDAGRATSYTREKLPEHILKRHAKPTGFSNGVGLLLEHTRIVVAGIRTTIADKVSIPRRELLGELCDSIGEVPLIFVTGEAGSGKSVLVKAAFLATTPGVIGFAFRAVSLAGTHINDVLDRFGLTLSQLQAQTAVHERKLLWIESLEQLLEKPPEQRAAFLDLLRGLKSDPKWHLVITCRTYSAETVRAAFFNEAGVSPGNIEVGNLSDAELDDVAVDFPSLERPLLSPTLRRLLKNPFFLDMAARMDWSATDPLPSNERAFREKVWRDIVRRVDEDLELGLPNLRERTLEEVALSRAKALEPFVAAADLDARALARLVRDSILETPESGSNLYAPAHDVFEDWALMRWLNDEFGRNGRQLDSLVNALGTHPALRRAFRKWLTESLNADQTTTDSLVLALIQNVSVGARWREDTMVGVLQSADARGFLRRNAKLLLDNDASLLRQVIHILRVACRAAIPRRLFGVTSEGEFFLPKGNGWIGAGELMAEANPLFTEADLPLIVGFLEDWMLLTKYGVQYPKGSRSIAKVAWYWFLRIPWRSPVSKGKERLLRVLLTIPIAAEPDLTKMAELALDNRPRSRADDTILKLIFNHFASAAVFRDLPDLAFRAAERVLGLDRTLEEIVADRSDYDMEAVSYAFGLGKRSSMDDFPASAYHGPYLQMLWHHPNRGVDFILRLINRACEAYGHPNNRYAYIEPPGTIKIQLPGGEWREQFANGRLWGAYRGMGVIPHCFESALMALEHWLLEKAKRGDPELEAVLVDLLRRSNNVGITAVVASVAVAHPTQAGEAAYSLLTCRLLLRADHDRSVQESFHIAQWGGLRLGSIDWEKGIYEKEREESSRLAHRRNNLEYVAVVLQMTEKFQQRVWSLIDAYRAELPPESEQDHETKVWRLQLHRIDTRRFVEAGRTDDGRILIGSVEPESDLQKFIQDESPRFAALDSAMTLLTWGQSVFASRAPNSEKWREQLAAAESLVTSGYGSGTEDVPATGGPAYVAAVCIRDHWGEMSPKQQNWCARTVCNAVEADADLTDHLHVVAQNPMEGSRPAAFILSVLFDKALPPATQTRLLPTLAKAVMHAVGETASYAVQGIGRFLWPSDRALALTCLQALVTSAVEKHYFSEIQLQRTFLERESDEAFETKLRSEMREFIINRRAADEEQIVTLDLGRWPGRTVAKHLFSIVTQQPNDPLAQQLMCRCIASLPLIWEANQRAHRVDPLNRSEERYDPQFEHDLVDAACRFLLQLTPDKALTLLASVFEATPRFPDKAADVVTWLILHQGDRAPAPTLWVLWQRFADDFATSADAEKIDDEFSEEAKLLRELFLGVNWKEQRDWLPLHGETQRIRALFQRLPPTELGFECYAYYLAKAGTPTLPDAIDEYAAKLREAKIPTLLLNETAIFYLEEILTRLIYGGNSLIRTDSNLRQATLYILDALVAAGSSCAYKLRDDFLTPSH